LNFFSVCRRFKKSTDAGVAYGQHPSAAHASAFCGVQQSVQASAAHASAFGGLHQSAQASPLSSSPLLALPAPSDVSALQEVESRGQKTVESQNEVSQGSNPQLERKNCRSLELELDAAVEEGGEAYKCPASKKNLLNHMNLANVVPPRQESLHQHSEAQDQRNADQKEPAGTQGSPGAGTLEAGTSQVQKPTPVPVKESMQRLKEAVALRDQEKKAKQGIGSAPRQQKKPAAASKPALKKPASSSSSLKRPACAKQHVQSDDKRAKHGKITKQQAKKLKPLGCSKCRNVEGCTRSCWLNRGYDPDW